MKKMLLLVVLSGLFLASSCTNPVLTCDNPLDASQFGFSLTVPQNFVCQYSASSSNLLSPSVAAVIWNDGTASQMLSLAVYDLSVSAIPAVPAGLDYTTLADIPATALTFSVVQGVQPATSTTTGGSIFYIAQANLPGGRYAIRIILGVGPTDATGLATLTTVLNGVAL
jgi:hypothetical protein